MEQAAILLSVPFFEIAEKILLDYQITSTLIIRNTDGFVRLNPTGKEDLAVTAKRDLETLRRTFLG